jgi:hypothetical protein
VCDENDRAVPGLRRFMVRALGVEKPGGAQFLAKYVLAPDRATAESLYLAHEADDIRSGGFDPQTRQRKDGDTVVAFDLRTDELPD